MIQEDQLECEDTFLHLPQGYVLPPRECCGSPDDGVTDIEVPCITGDCTVLYCRCGRSTESGWGRIGCRCQAESSGHWRVFERQMISVGNVALSTRKRRGRTR